jgi:hypothetical protein
METFNNILIVLLLGIVVFLFFKSEKKCRCEKFSTEEDMNGNESQNIMNACKFSLECCPSMYSSDRGCMCMGTEEEEILLTRGYNRTTTDGFGY